LFGMTEQSHVVAPDVPASTRAAREARGISLRALASQLGVSPATLSAVETGRTPLTVDRLQRIADLLDFPLARLLRGDVLPPPAGPHVGPEAWRRYEDLALGSILDAATKLFVQHGYHATSVREVAAEARVSVAGIYHHYPSKQHLLVALLDITMTEIRWRLLAARDEGTTAQDAFALMVESLALFHAVRGDLAFLGASEMRGIAEPDLSRITALRDEVQHLLDEQASLAFPGVEVRASCRAIATMCTSLPSWFRSDGSLSPHQIAKHYADLALKMLQ